MAGWILTMEKSLKNHPRAWKRQVLNYDHDLDMHYPIFMAFMSKAALNTINCKFFNLRQSLVSFPAKLVVLQSRSSVVRTLHLAQKNWVRSPRQTESCQWKSHWKIIPGLGKWQVLNYDHDLDMLSAIFMAFLSKAALNTINCKIFINLGQSLVSSMVEFWLCAQWNWVQSSEVPSHWNSAVSKKNEVDLSQLSWRV